MILILGTFQEVKSNLGKYEQEDVEVQREQREQNAKLCSK